MCDAGPTVATSTALWSTPASELPQPQRAPRPSMQLCVDASQPLWMLFGLHGSITQIRILGECPARALLPRGRILKLAPPRPSISSSLGGSVWVREQAPTLPLMGSSPKGSHSCLVHGSHISPDKPWGGEKSRGTLSFTLRTGFTYIPVPKQLSYTLPSGHLKMGEKTVSTSNERFELFPFIKKKNGNEDLCI